MRGAGLEVRAVQAAWGWCTMEAEQRGAAVGGPPVGGCSLGRGEAGDETKVPVAGSIRDRRLGDGGIRLLAGAPAATHIGIS